MSWFWTGDQNGLCGCHPVTLELQYSVTVCKMTPSCPARGHWIYLHHSLQGWIWWRTPSLVQCGDVGVQLLLFQTPAVSLNKRHSPPWLNLQHRKNSPSCQELGKVITHPGWCLGTCSWCEHQPLKSRWEWRGACSNFPLHSGERVYPCSIRTPQSTWDKSTLKIKGYLKLIEIKWGHLPGTMTNPLHPLCREPRLCTFPLQGLHSLSWLTITDTLMR